MKYPNFNEEKKLWKKGYKYVAGLDEAGRGCERANAEVLTNNGWKFYSNLDVKDKVLSYTHNGYMEWQKIEKIIEKDFEGNLVELKNRGIDIVVTADHYFNVLRRVFRRDKKDNNVLKLVGYKMREERILTSDLDANDFIPRGGIWKGKCMDSFILLKTHENEEKSIDITLWVAFLGIFLSEGCVSYDKKKGSYKITISQSKNVSSQKYKKISELLKKSPFKFNELENGFNCYNKQLYMYLKKIGKCYDKFIPSDIKELPPDLLNILIYWMMLGDGTCYTNKNRQEVCVYYTVSEELKDDFEEILLKAGWTYHTIVKPLKDRYIGSRLIKKENQTRCFEIRLRRNNKAQIKSLHKKELPYKGKVFCLHLSQYHNFFVRRNGTGYFTGNSLAGPVVAGAVVIKNLKSILNEPIFKKVKDSKMLSAEQREEIYNYFKKNTGIEWGIGIVSEKVIDKINILEATRLAMKKAVMDLEKKLGKKTNNSAVQKTHDRENSAQLNLIVDGNIKLNIDLPQKAIIKADQKVFSCALASIFAKVTRDKIMQKEDKKYPEYGFNQHKGYGTSRHFKMLKKHGPCKIHRKSFHPVRNF